MTKRRRLLAALVLPPASVLLLLLMLELGFAIVRPVPFALAAALTVDRDPHTAYRLRPGSVVHYHRGIRTRVNSAGMRGPDVSPAKNGVFRILAVGDSFTFGTDVGDEEAFPVQLESLLGERDGRPVQVVNSAVPGWGPFQYAQYYEHYGRRWDPDLVLVGFFVGNDAYSPHRRVSDVRLTAVAGRRVRREVAGDRWLPAKVWLYEHSHLARWITNQKLVVAEDFTRDDCQAFSPSLIDMERSTLRVHLRRGRRAERSVWRSFGQILRIQRALEADGIPLLVVLIPTETQIHPALARRVIPPQQRSAYDLDMPNTLLRELFEAQGITVVDLVQPLRKAQRAGGPCLYMNDAHWTPAAHRLAAKIIAARLPPVATLQ